MATPPKFPKKTSGDLPRGQAVGINATPPTQFTSGDPVTASQLRAISEQAARPNQLQRSQTGFNFGPLAMTPEFKMPGLFFEGILLEDMPASSDPMNDPVVVKMRLLKPLAHKDDVGQEAISFGDNGGDVTIVNRATDISGSEGDRVLCVVVNGELRPTGGGGLGNEWVDFEVLEAGCPDFAAGQSQWVWGEVIRTSCESSVSDGDEIKIFDPGECVFDIPVEILIGRRGRASLNRSTGFVDIIVCAVSIETPDRCAWCADYLYCGEVIYSAS